MFTTFASDETYISLFRFVRNIMVLHVSVSPSNFVSNLFLCYLYRAKQLIKDAILDNDFTKNFDVAQTKEIVDCMYPKHFDAGQIIIREGDAGAEFYVAAGKSTFNV